MASELNDKAPVKPEDAATEESPARFRAIEAKRPAGRWRFLYLLAAVVILAIYPLRRVAELPSCTSPVILEQVESSVSRMFGPGKVKLIDGHREIGGDQKPDIRRGQCTIYTTDGDFEACYSVEWNDKQRRTMFVRVWLTAPLCDNPLVVKQVKDGIGREGNFGLASGFEMTTVNSIEGHRQISMDDAAGIRHCGCVIQTAAGDIPSRYFTKWNRETGQMEAGSEM